MTLPFTNMFTQTLVARRTFFHHQEALLMLFRFFVVLARDIDIASCYLVFF